MRQLALRALLLCTLGSALSMATAAQSPPQDTNAGAAKAAPDAADKTGAAVVAGNLSGAEAIERRLREQREEIESLRALVLEQTRLVKELKERVERAEQQQQAAQQPAQAVVRDASYAAALPSSNAGTTPAERETAGAAQDAKLEERVARVEKASEAVTKQLAGITFSGDLRFRYESIYGQQNSLASADTPGALGNPLTPRQRLRVRARFGARGSIGREFEWGLRLSTGSFADAIASNQTFTDFYNRKPFALDNAYLTWKPSAVPGLQVQGGKFDTPWLRTELTWDNDLNVEGSERELHAHVRGVEAEEPRLRRVAAPDARTQLGLRARRRRHG